MRDQVNDAHREEDDAADAEELDPRWVELLQYITGEGTDAERVATKARLEHDPDFAAFAAPILAVWVLPWEEADAALLKRLTEEERPASEWPTQEDVDRGLAALDRKARELGLDMPVLRPGWGENVACADGGRVGEESPDRGETVPQLRVELGGASVGTDSGTGSGTDRRRPDVSADVSASPRGHRRLRRGRILGIGTAIAAAIPFVILLDKWVVHPIRHYEGGAAGAVVTLSDRSQVELAPGAYLGEDRAFQRGATRTVYLFGRARFHVQHDPARPFRVEVIGARATALGTTFRMAADTTALVRVVVTDGKVRLEVRDTSGVYRQVSVLTREQVQNVSLVFQEMTAAGAVLSRAGVPLGESHRLYQAMLRGFAAVMRQKN